MNFDFQAIMLLALIMSGLIWGLDVLVFSRQRAAGMVPGAIEPQEPTPVLVEYAKSFFPIILIVLIIRSFLIEPFRIPSGSMLPTLLVGDFILVNKFSYGVRLPLFGSKVISVGEPKRGDVVVFRYPRDPSVDYIKRIVGLPGDRVHYENKTIYINGERVPQKSLGIYTGVGEGIEVTGASLREEHLGDVDHQILIQTSRKLVEGDFEVPKGRYFVMGDNRDNSNDSRFWGTVPEENLVGKAFMIWMNWDKSKGGVTWSRLGTGIK